MPSPTLLSLSDSDSDKIIEISSSSDDDTSTRPLVTHREMPTLEIGQPSTSTGITHRETPTSNADIQDIQGVSRGAKRESDINSGGAKRKSDINSEIKRLKLSIAVQQAQRYVAKAQCGRTNILRSHISTSTSTSTAASGNGYRNIRFRGILLHQRCRRQRNVVKLRLPFAFQ